MVPRDPTEEHRASTPLELFFDLTFAVAVAQAAGGLQNGLSHGNVFHELVAYPLIFFGVWWGWMNFTWFASAYDVDDVAYRVAVLVQMTGVLILAAGIPRALEHWNFSLMVVGYVVMRLAMISLWLRAAVSDPAGRRCALRYATGIGIIQLGWVAWLLLPATLRLWFFLVLAGLELLVPIWAESVGRTPWHPRHIAERYGLFTIIVLGEVVLVTTLGVQRAMASRATLGELVPVLVGGLLVVFSMWWFYFDMPANDVVEEVRVAFNERLTGAFAWGYGHYVVFASAAAAGAGIGVAIKFTTHHSQLTQLEAGFVATVPVACYLLAVWALHASYKAPSAIRNYSVPVASLLIIASSFTGEPLLFAGLVSAALVGVKVVVFQREQAMKS
jgi:low temperature requirement protein LtrA